MTQHTCIPFYEDGDHISGYCTAAVIGKRFVKISGDRSGGTIDLAATTHGDGGAPHIAHADAGGRIFGVSGYDGAQYATIDVLRGSKMVVPVTAGAILAAFDEVAVGIGGTAVPAGSEATVAASTTTGVVGNNNAIKWTAVTGGAAGNDITVDYVAASGSHNAGDVTVDGNDITVYVAAGFATTTAAQVIAAVQASAEASAIVTVANASTSTGAAAVADISRTSLAGGAEGGRADQAVGYVLTSCATGGEAQVSLY